MTKTTNRTARAGQQEILNRVDLTREIARAIAAAEKAGFWKPYDVAVYVRNALRSAGYRVSKGRTPVRLKP